MSFWLICNFVAFVCLSAFIPYSVVFIVFLQQEFLAIAIIDKRNEDLAEEY